MEHGGILRISKEVLIDFIFDLITGKKKLVNKNLKLVGITRVNDDVIFWSYAYDFCFTADDLPVIPEGCSPNPNLKIKQVKDNKYILKEVK